MLDYIGYIGYILRSFSEMEPNALIMQNSNSF